MMVFVVGLLATMAWAQTVSLNPGYAQRNLGGKVRMHIILSEATGLLSMGIKISFNPTMLQVDTDLNKTSKNKNVWRFAELLTNPLAYAPDIDIDNVGGTVTMIGGRLKTGISGSNILLGWITFDCIAGNSSHTTKVPINIQLAHPHNPPHPPPDSYDNFVRENGDVNDPNMNINNNPTQLGTICIVDTSINPIVACEGDITGAVGGGPDGRVKRNDKVIFNTAYSFSFPDANYNPVCDFDADGKVKRSDKSIFNPNYGRTDCPCNP